jgi:hypothetical protein
VNHIGICLRESANICDPMKHVILTKWNANSYSTNKVILINKNRQTWSTWPYCTHKENK